MGKNRADLAAVSDLLEPEMLTWLGIQLRIVLHPLFVKEWIVFDGSQEKMNVSAASVASKQHYLQSHCTVQRC